MILVRMVFQVKWGMVREVVEEMKRNEEMFQRIHGPDVKVRILTDLSGNFNTVVQEIEVESLAAWESQRDAMFADPEFQERVASAPPPFDGGTVEFYTIEQ